MTAGCHTHGAGAAHAATAPPIPLALQIACVERDLRLRRRLLTKSVRAGRLSAATAHDEILRMQAVLRTLTWLAANESRIKARISMMAGIERDPVMQHLQRQFPGASIAAVHESPLATTGRAGDDT